MKISPWLFFRLGQPNPSLPLRCKETSNASTSLLTQDNIDNNDNADNIDNNDNADNTDNMNNRDNMDQKDLTK
jgi:hypothetical protein